MGDYKVLHTFSPAFDLWGELREPGSPKHARVIHLAMVEYPPEKWSNAAPSREVIAFSANGSEVAISDGRGSNGRPCRPVSHAGDPDLMLFCPGHKADQS